MEDLYLCGLVGAGVGLLLGFLIFISEDDGKDDFIDFLINVTAYPVKYLMKLVNCILTLGAIALFIYLLIEHTWWVVTPIALIIAFLIILCSNDHNKEMEFYQYVLRLLKRGDYEIAENVLNQEAKNMGAEKVGSLHSSLIELIHSLKKKEGKRKPKVWNIYIYDPIKPNHALVPVSHYQAGTTI